MVYWLKSSEKVRLVIWCSPETRRRFKLLAARHDKSYEETLIMLMNHYEKTWIDVEVFGEEKKRWSGKKESV